MSVISNLTAIAITPTEQSTVLGVTPFEDATGMLTALVAQLNEIKLQLAYLNGNMPAGANKTAIATVITNLA